MGKKIGIILGNGFSIDFLNHVTKRGTAIWDFVDVTNLFKYGDVLNWPRNNTPGFLSYKNTPNLWNIGARPFLDSVKTLQILERVVTSANVYSLKKKSSIDTGAGNGYLAAYKELVYYLKYLFIYYNSKITDVAPFIPDWAWADFFKRLHSSGNVDEVDIITYNYDIWLERILNSIGIPFDLPELIPTTGAKFKLFKPHGSISFLHKVDLPMDSFEINYKSFTTDCDLSDISIAYDNLCKHTAFNFLIPPAGESGRTALNWTNSIKTKVQDKFDSLVKGDTVIVSGISYWHVDRREIDDILVRVDDDIDVININPNTDIALESVLNSLFRNYLHYNTSTTLGGMTI